MTTRDRTKIFKTMRNGYKARVNGVNATTSSTTSSSAASLTDASKKESANSWEIYTETAKTNINFVKKELKVLDKLMSAFFIVNFDDEEDNSKLQKITDLSKTITTQCNVAKNALLQANAIPILSQNKNEINMRKNMISNLVLQLDDYGKQFRAKEKTFMSKYKTMISNDNDSFNLSKSSLSTKSSYKNSESIPLLSEDLYQSKSQGQRQDKMLEKQLAEKQQTMLQEQKLLQEQKEMSDTIDQRDIEIRKLGQSVTEVSQLFQDLSLLTLEQGAIIDRIDNNLENTSHNVENGVGQLREANKLQKSGRPIRCWILLIVAVLILIGVILVIVFTTRDNSVPETTSAASSFSTLDSSNLILES